MKAGSASSVTLFVRFGSHGKTTKNAKTRVVPLFGLGLEAARRWAGNLADLGAEERPWSHVPDRGAPSEEWEARHGSRWRSPTRAARRARRLAGRPQSNRPSRLVALASPHGCVVARRGLVGKKWRIEEVRQFMGHSSIKVTERYAHLADSTLHEIAQATHAGWSARAEASCHAVVTTTETPDNQPNPEGLQSRMSSVRIGPGVPERGSP
jgi:integrase